MIGPKVQKDMASGWAAGFADATTEGLIGNAILPSLLHQDPRYFYQGSGTKKSRALHAILAPFICKGDNGKTQPNYSNVGRQSDFLFYFPRVLPKFGPQCSACIQKLWNRNGPACCWRFGARVYFGQTHKQR